MLASLFLKGHPYFNFYAKLRRPKLLRKEGEDKKEIFDHDTVLEILLKKVIRIV
jgi:hypothetical protein